MLTVVLFSTMSPPLQPTMDAPDFAGTAVVNGMNSRTRTMLGWGLGVAYKYKSVGGSCIW